MDQPPLQVGALSANDSASCCAVLNIIAEEFNLQQRKEEAHRRVTKRKCDYDLTVLAAAVLAFSVNIRRFWVDVQSSEWIRLLLNGIMLQDDQFEKTFRMSRNSFAVLHDLLGITLNNQRRL
jgi:hypothetical protein